VAGRGGGQRKKKRVCALHQFSKGAVKLIGGNAQHTNCRGRGRGRSGKMEGGGRLREKRKRGGKYNPNYNDKKIKYEETGKRPEHGTYTLGAPRGKKSIRRAVTGWASLYAQLWTKIKYSGVGPSKKSPRGKRPQRGADEPEAIKASRGDHTRGRTASVWGEDSERGRASAALPEACVPLTKTYHGRRCDRREGNRYNIKRGVWWKRWSAKTTEAATAT